MYEIKTNEVTRLDAIVLKRKHLFDEQVKLFDKCFGMT